MCGALSCNARLPCLQRRRLSGHEPELCALLGCATYLRTAPLSSTSAAFQQKTSAQKRWLWTSVALCVRAHVHNTANCARLVFFSSRLSAPSRRRKPFRSRRAQRLRGHAARHFGAVTEGRRTHRGTHHSIQVYLPISCRMPRAEDEPIAPQPRPRRSFERAKHGPLQPGE